MRSLLIVIAAALLLAKTAFADLIHDAANTGDIEEVQSELKAGADVNAKDDVEHTPLHSAAEQVHKTIVELLIAKGTEVNAKYRYGLAPVYEGGMAP